MSAGQKLDRARPITAAGETSETASAGLAPIAAAYQASRDHAAAPLVFVDLETSGANLANDRIIEIGLIEVDHDGSREWNVLVNPERPIARFVTALTGIDDAMVRNAPTFGELAPELLARLRGRLLIAHNARFDYGFLKCEFKRLGIDFRSKTLCTVKLSRKLFPGEYLHNLDTLVARHRLTVAGARHRALTDARLLRELWRLWHEQLPGATVDDAIAAIVGHPCLPPQIDPALADDLPEGAGVYAFYGEDDRLLLIRRSSNIRRQVFAHFGDAPKSRALAEGVRRIEWHATAGEFGARLREMTVVRQAGGGGSVSPSAGGRPPAPLASKAVCSWQLETPLPGVFRPRLVLADEVDFASSDDLYGLYSTRREAWRALRAVADEHHLCYRQLGLEEDIDGHACSAYARRNCRGVCVGKESAALHGVRLLTAISRWKLQRWAYSGPIALVERDAFGLCEDLHIFDRWRYLGTVHSEEALAEVPTSDAGGFDPDVYRLLKRCLQAGKMRVVPLRSTRS